MNDTINTTQIGDGQLPNKYWVSINEDHYLYDPEEGYLNWISDSRPEEKFRGKTFDPFDTFADAVEFVNKLDLEDTYDDIVINHVSIEDRISGQIYERTLEAREVTLMEYDVFQSTDLDFTIEAMTKAGVEFE